VPERYADDDHLSHRTQLVAASYVVLRRGDEVLLHLRRGTGYRDGHWALPAGHVEPGEAVDEAAAREAREEVGVEPQDLRPLTAMHRFDPHGPAVEQRVDVFFEATRWAGTPTIREPDKAADLRWFPLTALPEPVVPHERSVLDALASGRVLPPVVVWRTDLEDS
jgi:8-oxo-dGTP pyrophosphatase MutT (NUDIX family)